MADATSRCFLVQEERGFKGRGDAREWGAMLPLPSGERVAMRGALALEPTCPEAFQEATLEQPPREPGPSPCPLPGGERVQRGGPAAWAGRTPFGLLPRRLGLHAEVQFAASEDLRVVQER